MADMEHIDPLRIFQHTVDHAIDMRLAPVEQVPEPRVFRGRRSAVGQFFQGKNSFFKPLIPLQRRFGIAGANILEKESKVAPRSRRDSNESILKK